MFYECLNWKCRLLIFSMILSVTGLIYCSVLAEERSPVDAKADEADGNWYQYRGDRRLSGYCGLKGDIDSAPSILWKYFIGGRQHLLTARLGDDSTVTLKPEDLPMPCSDEGVLPASQCDLDFLAPVAAGPKRIATRPTAKHAHFI